SRFPIPDSRFPIPDSRFPIPDSRFPIPDSRIPNPETQFSTFFLSERSVLASRKEVPLCIAAFLTT
ncbi:hypothetical protein, partial [Vibrio sp. B1FIG11]|uniref:hypothetical protein n=1 Tax=Vibrio sp. B1FIG11 TaxID=2751177 RepID=UPI001C7134F4